MGCNSSQREVHSNTVFLKEKKHEKSQINNLTYHLKELEKEEQIKPKVSRRKEIIKIKKEINIIEIKKQKKISNTKSWFFVFPFSLNLFIYRLIDWLCWVFVAACGLSLVAVRGGYSSSGGYSSLWCVGFSLRWLLLLWSTGSRHVGFRSCGTWALSAGSVVVAHGLSCSAACGIFLGQSLNPCPLHGQADS